MSLEALLSEVFAAPTEAEKGWRFERIVVWTLRNAAQYRELFSDVWLWTDWPGNDGRDIGIDVVAQPKDGSFPWAVQAKAYSEKYAIKKKDIDSFVSASPLTRFSFRLMVATTDKVGANAQRALETQGNLGELLRTSLEELQVSWPDSLRGLTRAVPKPKPKRPRRHQREAIEDVLASLHRNKRAQVLMPCGTGKTLLGLWLSEARKARTTLFLAPSLALVRQTLQEWSANSRSPFNWIAVCSDQTVADDQGKATRDSDTREHTSDLGVPVTTDPAAVAAFLTRRGRKVIFSTYQSSARIAEALDLSEGRIDLAICDEAHRLAGVTDRNFGSVLDDSRLPVGRRVFLTATPRIYTPRIKNTAQDAGVLVASMDDESVFGPVAHRLSFAEAIDRELLADYRVVVVGVLDTELSAILDAPSVLLKDTDRQTDPRALAGLVALSKEMKRFNLRRVISFHSSVMRAQRFRSLAEDCLPLMQTTPKGRFVAEHVNGTMTTGQRDHTLRTLRLLPGMKAMLVTNSRCLAEGVDVPELDALVFADPRRSRIDVVQCVGRAIRRTTDDKVGTLILPVPILRGEEPARVLAASEFDTVWQVLCALRAHDDRLAEEIDALARRTAASSDGRLPKQLVLELPAGVFELKAFIDAFSARVVEVAAEPFQVGLGYCRLWWEENGSLASVKRGTVFRNFRLGAWLDFRRYEYRNNRLLGAKVAALDELGIDWDPRATQWEQALAACRAWCEENGSLASAQHPTVVNGFHLGSWLDKRRQERKNDQLSRDRIAALDELGMVWDPLDSQWEDCLAVCRQWCEGNGSLASVVRGTVFNGFKLGAWLSDRRTRRDKLSEDKIAALDALGIVWDPLEVQWEEGLAVCRQWCDENGSLASVRNATVFNGFSLGGWLSARRGGRDRLSKEQITALDELGVVWDPLEVQWENNLAVCRQWCEENGSLSSVRYNTVVDGFKLGAWLSNRRSRMDRLSKEQITALDELGIVWDPLEAQWEEGLAVCRQWCDENGSLASVKVPTTVFQQFQLGNWLHRRRQERKRGSLTLGRIAALDEIGMVWSRREAPTTRPWEFWLELCRDWCEENGSLATVKATTVFKEHRLGGWLHSRRQERRKGSLSEEKISALDKLGIVWEPLKAQRESVIAAFTDARA